MAFDLRIFARGRWRGFLPTRSDRVSTIFPVGRRLRQQPSAAVNVQSEDVKAFADAEEIVVPQSFRADGRFFLRPVQQPNIRLQPSNEERPSVMRRAADGAVVGSMNLHETPEENVANSNLKLLRRHADRIRSMRHDLDEKTIKTSKAIRVRRRRKEPFHRPRARREEQLSISSSHPPPRLDDASRRPPFAGNNDRLMIAKDGKITKNLPATRAPLPTAPT